MSILPETRDHAGGEVVDDDRIEELARLIHSGHQRVRRSGRELIEDAIEVGERILEARTLVPRGEWIRWLNENCELAGSTAYSYEHLAMGRDVLLAAWEEGRVIGSIASALHLLKPGTTYGQSRRRIPMPSSRRVPIEDVYIERGATWLRNQFPKTFGKMPPARRRQVSEDLAAGFLRAALGAD